jgi:uncharacterized SAM-binding protein YcdF (DUF218 family)
MHRNTLRVFEVLRARRVDVGIGLCLGTLGTLLVDALGGWQVAGIPSIYAVVAGSIVGGAIGFARANAIIASIDGLILFAYYLAALSPLIETATQRWVRQDEGTPVGVDAVVVLSSGLKSDSSLQAVGADRLLSGLGLLAAGAAPRLVTTRVRERYGNAEVVSDSDQLRLIHLAGRDSVWTVVPFSETTREEAINAAAVLLPRGIRKIALVTSPLHTRRACAAFERVGFVVHCVPARERDHVTWHPRTADDRLAAVRVYLYERLGFWKYRINGWIQAHTDAKASKRS